MRNGIPANDYLVAARFYDLFYNFWEDTGFYVSLAQRTGGPVLDAMCGTGRVTIPIARAGIKVVGVDRNETMLDILSEKLAKEKPLVRRNLRIKAGDVRTANLGGPYSLAVIAWNSLPEIASLEDQRAAILNIAKHLKPGGLFALHTDNPADVRPTWELFKGIGVTEEGVPVSMHSTTVRKGKHLYDLLFRYEISERRGHRRQLNTRVEMFFPTKAEMEKMMEDAGMRVMDVFGDYDLRPYSPRCKYMIFIARKRFSGINGQRGR